MVEIIYQGDSSLATDAPSFCMPYVSFAFLYDTLTGRLYGTTCDDCWTGQGRNSSEAQPEIRRRRSKRLDADRGSMSVDIIQKRITI